MRLDRVINENIDQDTQFFDEVLPASTAELWIDLEKVKIINSTGILRWMRWCKALPAGIRVYLLNVPGALAVQGHLIDRFFPPFIKIQSVRGYFFCEDDSQEVLVNMERNKDYFYAEDMISKKSEVRLPKVACPLCSKIMAPDFLESRVFAFLKVDQGAT